jgi:hypothetical protein
MHRTAAEVSAVRAAADEPQIPGNIPIHHPKSSGSKRGGVPIVFRRPDGTLRCMCGWATDYCKIDDDSDSQPKTKIEAYGSAAILTGTKMECIHRDLSLEFSSATSVSSPPAPVTLKAH